MARGEIRYVPIDAARMQRFRADAPAALARRGGGFLAEQWIASSELLLVAVIGLVGLHALGWSAEAALACLLAGVWAKTAGDLIKYLLARPAVLRATDGLNRDAAVWLVAGALSRGRRMIRDDRESRYLPGPALLFEFAFGGIATGVLAHVGGLLRADVWEDLLAQPHWRWTLLGMVWWQLMTAALSALRHAWQGERAGPLPFSAGARGFGLFLVMFPVMFLYGEDGEGVNPQGVMQVLNYALLLLGLLMLFGSWLMQRETRWLRRWLADGGRA